MRILLVLLFLGASAFVSIAFPAVQLLLMLSFIGLPVAIFLMVAPFLFLFAMVWLLLRQLVFRFFPRRRAFIGSLIATAALFAFPALYDNILTYRLVTDVRSGDRSELEMPLGGSTIALQRRASRYHTSEGAPACDGFCMHALLTGEVERFIHLQAPERGQPFDPSLPGTAFYFERRDTCPQIEFSLDGRHGLVNPDRSAPRTERIESAQIAGVRILDGLCFIQQPATAQDADYVIFQGEIEMPEAIRGLSIPLRVIRGSVFQANGDDWDEIYRRSAIRAEPMFPLFIPAMSFDFGGGNIREEFGLLHYERLIGSDSQFRLEFNWYSFLTDELGYNLDLETVEGENREQRREEQRELVRTIATRTQPLSQEEVNLALGYVEARMNELSSSPANGAVRAALPLDDQGTIIAVLENPAIPVQMGFSIRSHTFASSLDPSLHARFADAMVGRLLNVAHTQTPPFDAELTPMERDRSQALEILGRSTWAAAGFLEERHLEPLTIVARNAILNERASSAFIGFASLGQAGVAPLRDVLRQLEEWKEAVETIDRPWGLRRPSAYGTTSRVWDNVRRALCEMGPLAAEVLPQAVAGVQGMQPRHRSVWITAFIRMGMEPDALWQALYADSELDRERFDHEVSRAASNSSRCR